MKGKLEAAGGKFRYKDRTNKLTAKELAISKIIGWGDLLNEGYIPTKFCKPGKDGTSVHFVIASGDEEIMHSYDFLQMYIHSVNEEFNTEISCNITKTKRGTP